MNDSTPRTLKEQLNISGKPLPQDERSARWELTMTNSQSLSQLEKLDFFFLLNYINVLKGARTPNHGNVYVMRAGDVFKIGLSTNPERRRIQIAEYIPTDVEIVITLETWDMYGLEQSLHSLFLGSKVDGQREWFFLTPSDLNFIKGLAL